METKLNFFFLFAMKVAGCVSTRAGEGGGAGGAGEAGGGEFSRPT